MEGGERINSNNWFIQRVPVLGENQARSFGQVDIPNDIQMNSQGHPGNINWIDIILAPIQKFCHSVELMEGTKTSIEIAFDRKDILR